jgi:hypothetical protein
MICRKVFLAERADTIRFDAFHERFLFFGTRVIVIESGF